ncbi:unnamed protein product [Darwinula stevensoni]|uniref:Golgin-45 n=1 Tax=Darwinula stevensoni TaxID=69355 RepID=A0A7R9A381_9CRUS|nr:unnamed protein product [Darwinula stevensoni]CAG0890190.1 unnamed protein product [Darwinula stevensoni]
MGNAASEDEKEMEQKEGALVHLSPENVLAEDVRKRLTLVQQNHDLPHSRKPEGMLDLKDIPLVMRETWRGSSMPILVPPVDINCMAWDSPGLLTERSQGDGMERIEASLEEYGYQAENFPLPLMKSPEKLPDSAILLPPAKTAERNRENLLSRKEPKFVPYEPYRGAVKPIIPQPRPHRRRHRKLSGSSVVSLPIGHEKSESPVEWEEERRELEREMEELRKEKQELAHQVAMESQVNTELKKLLVACMGEDFESKLVGLTRDKAQLGDRVQKFTNTLSMELEEKDRLFGQCEVWKSKFLASSLLVDELLRCKAAMGKRLTDAHAALRGLLDEHKEIHGNLIRLSRSLESSGSAQGSVDVRKLNAVELSSVLQGVGVENGIGPSPEQCSLSPAEGIAIRVLSQALPEPELLTAEVLSRQVQGSAQPYLRLGIAPNNDVRYEKLTVNCCDKCDGEIHIM